MTNVKIIQEATCVSSVFEGFTVLVGGTGSEIKIHHNKHSEILYKSHITGWMD